MSLSPDECKWSERLTLTPRGVRCGFTDTCVCVLEEVDVSTVWMVVETVVRACVCHSRLSPNPASPRTLTSSACPASHRKTRWPRRRRWVRVCLPVPIPKWAEPVFYFFFRQCFPLESTVLHLNFQLSKNTCAQQVVLLMSQAHLHPFDSTPCHLIATTAVHAEEPARFYHWAVQPHAFTGLHHEHPHMQAYTHSSSNEISPSPMLSVLKEHNRI